MISLNNIIISGRLTQNPDVKLVGGSNRKLAKVGIAYNKEFYAQSGKKKETVFIDVQVWEKVADFVEKYLKKGDLCIVEGELTMESWKTKNGEFKSKIAIRAKSIQKIRLAKAGDEEDFSDAEDTYQGKYLPPSVPHYTEEDRPPTMQSRQQYDDVTQEYEDSVIPF